MDGHLEPLAAILRVGGAYGAPWTWAGVLRFSGPTAVHVEAVERAPTPKEWRQAVATMRDAGIETFTFDRRDGNEVVQHRLSTHNRRRQMDSANLTLKIDAELRDPSAAADAPPAFFLKLDTGYVGLPYAAAVAIQESLATSLGGHTANCLQLGKDKAAKMAAEATK